jgi:hypothetical protein
MWSFIKVVPARDPYYSRPRIITGEQKKKKKKKKKATKSVRSSRDTHVTSRSGTEFFSSSLAKRGKGLHVDQGLSCSVSSPGTYTYLGDVPVLIGRVTSAMTGTLRGWRLLVELITVSHYLNITTN